MKNQVMFRTKATLVSILLASLSAGCNSGASKASDSTLAQLSSKASPVVVQFTDLQAASTLASKPKDTSSSTSPSAGAGPQLAFAYVDVDAVDLKLASGEENRLRLADTMGVIDLLKLKDGVGLPISEGELSAGTVVSQIRLVLNEAGNRLVMSDGSECALQTPSAQQSGLKVQLEEPFTVEPGYAYAISVDFDTEHSLVYQGNGGCLLKPVIRVAVHAQAIEEEPDDSASTPPSDGGTTDPGTVTPPTTGETDGVNGGSGSGSGSGETSTEPSPTPAPTPMPTSTPDPSSSTDYPDVQDNPGL